MPFDRPTWAVGTGDLKDEEQDARVSVLDEVDYETECKAMSSAAYAVHARTFDRYLSALRSVRAMCSEQKPMATWKANRFMIIDRWLPLHFDNTYVMPPIIKQDTNAFIWSTAQMSLRRTSSILDPGWTPLDRSPKPKGDEALPPSARRIFESPDSDTGATNALNPPTGP